MKQYFVYILCSKNQQSLYIGSTSNFVKRIYEHKNELLDGFSKKYNCKKLVYFEECVSAEDMVNRERNLKNWHRQWKVNLISGFNPKWRDLSEELGLSK